MATKYVVEYVDAKSIAERRKRLLASGKTDAELDACDDWWDPACHMAVADAGNTLGTARIVAKRVVASASHYGEGELMEVYEDDDGFTCHRFVEQVS